LKDQHSKQIQEVKLEMSTKMKAMQQDFITQIELRDKEITELQHQKVSV